jgi:hypothetical protein
MGANTVDQFRLPTVSIRTVVVEYLPVKKADMVAGREVDSQVLGSGERGDRQRTRREGLDHRNPPKNAVIASVPGQLITLMSGEVPCRSRPIQWAIAVVIAECFGGLFRRPDRSAMPQDALLGWFGRLQMPSFCLLLSRPCSRLNRTAASSLSMPRRSLSSYDCATGGSSAVK